MKEHTTQSPRLRAAPSPTGYVHIGNLRTFLYNYLYVKQQSGKFILRVEDTDQKRKVEGGIESIIEVLRLYGIEFDEGPEQGGEFGPYIQTERKEIYKKHAEILIEKGDAYRCFCTTERLDRMRKEQQDLGLPTGYDGHCRDLSPKEQEERMENGEKYVIRMKFPKDGETRFDDPVYGKISVPNESIDDQILLKSDGLPTYHFAVVVDDHLMGVTHVVRGREYLGDTPKNLFLYDAFGWPQPVYIHVPHILKPVGKGKLGKRDGALPAFGYLKKGYLPEAILNYIALIGWSPDPKKAKQSEIYSVEELIDAFDFSRIQKTGGRYDPKKLDHTAGKHIRELPTDQLVEMIFTWVDQIVLKDPIVGVEKDGWEGELEEAVKKYSKSWKDDVDYFKDALELVKERMVYFGQLPELLDFFYSDQLDWSADDWNSKNHSLEELRGALEGLLPILDTIFAGGDFSQHEAWEKAVRDFADKLEWRHGDMFMAVRSAVTGRLHSPPLLESMEVLGWDRSKRNIEDSIKWLESAAK